MYRKAALKIVRDLGEDALPEPSATATASELAAETKVEDQVPPPAVSTEDVSTTDPVTSATGSSSVAPAIESESSTDPAHKVVEQTTVTTEERKPVTIPDSVSLHITPENLKDYVGPPIYHKDRFYIRPPPAGVSTGLGYLGNGSGAVMPVEATVCGPPYSQLYGFASHD